MKFFFSLSMVATLATTISVAATQAFAREAWEIKSPVDRFTIEVIGPQQGRIGNKDVSLKPITKYSTTLLHKFEHQCPALPKTAPTEITHVKGDQRQTWRLYLKQNMISDGANCLIVEGDGVYELPIHRQWFLNPPRSSIDLGTQFSLLIGGDTLTFKSDKAIWRNADDTYFTNWDLVDNFVNAARDFELSYRSSKKDIKSGERFTLKTKNKTYNFYRVGNDWGLDIENPNWFVVSASFRFIKNTAKDSWRSKYSQDLELLKKRDAPLEQRIAVLKKLSGTWNSDVKHAYQDLILDISEDVEIKRQVAKILKYRPTDDSILALANALFKTDDPELLYLMTDALRARNPRGPRVNTNDSSEEIERKIQEWKKWASEFQTTPHK